MAYDFDVFFSYNRADSDIVQAIARRLINDGYRVFFDRFALIPGEIWQSELELALDRSATCAVFLGPYGISPWANQEMRTALDLRAKKKMLRVIPVLLPAASTDNTSVPNFLSNLTWVDYRGGEADDQALALLKAGIGGYSPTAGQLTVKSVLTRSLGTTIVDSLVPVSNFQDRPELEVIREFWKKEGGSVLLLVGIGGAGKTALACRFLQELPNSGIPSSIPKNNDLQPANGVFAWSFYDHPDVERFVSSLQLFITQEDPPAAPAREAIYPLIRTIERLPIDNIALVLDGLEVVQENRGSQGGFGLLRDASLRHILRRIAQGGTGIKVILTSRYPLPELDPFSGGAYQVEEVDDFDETCARSLLRAGGVVGRDSELDGLIEEYGRHALTLTHLATVLRDFFDGNPKKARSIPGIETLIGATQLEAQARRIAKIFYFYQNNIPENEIKILRILSIFRIPVSLPLIVRLLSNLPASEIGNVLDLRGIIYRLSDRRLISVFGEKGNEYCAVHPSIRDYFYNSLESKEFEAHELARDHLFTLMDRPGRMLDRLDSTALDLVEEVIYHTVAAGKPEEALRLYELYFVGFERLGWELADFRRGRRIMDSFVERGHVKPIGTINRSCPSVEWALYQIELGEPEAAAHRIDDLAGEISKWDEGSRRPIPSDAKDLESARAWRRRHIDTVVSRGQLFILRQSLFDALVQLGDLDRARVVAEELVKEANEELEEGGRLFDYFHGRSELSLNPYGRMGICQFLTGGVADAIMSFDRATKLVKNGHHIGWLIRLYVRCGRLDDALEALKNWRAKNGRRRWPLVICWQDIVEAELRLVAGQYRLCRALLERSLSWSLNVGHQECFVNAKLLECRLSLRGRELRAAGEAAREALQQARGSNMLLLAIESALLRGHVEFQTGNHHLAEEFADEALRLAECSKTMYAWGVGDALHLRALVMQAYGNIVQAKRDCDAALTIRNKIGDIRRENTTRLRLALAAS